jgi:hypothetical protein
MPSILPNPTQYNLGLYDSSNGATIKTAHAVNISDVTQLKGGAYLFYGKAVRGLLVQIVRPYEPEDITLGAAIHFFVPELDRELNRVPHHNTLKSTAGDLGISGEQLVSLIREYQPR